MKKRGEPFKAFKGFAGMLGLAFLAYTCSKDYNANQQTADPEPGTQTGGNPGGGSQDTGGELEP